MQTLTRQENKMMAGLISGKIRKEIANDNSISLNTVKKHLKNAYRKMGVNGRFEAKEKYRESLKQQVA